MSRSVLRRAGVAVWAVLLGLTGCQSGSSDQQPAAFDQVADQATCLADATPVARPWPTGFPTDWPFPDHTTAYNVEERGADGTIVTAVSGTRFADILAFLNHDVVKAGFRIESGETEERDAEAEWEGRSFKGRWSIRESAECPGETVIQVLSAPE